MPKKNYLLKGILTGLLIMFFTKGFAGYDAAHWGLDMPYAMLPAEKVEHFMMVNIPSSASSSTIAAITCPPGYVQQVYAIPAAYLGTGIIATYDTSQQYDIRQS